MSVLENEIRFSKGRYSKIRSMENLVNGKIDQCIKICRRILKKEACVARECSKPLHMIGSLTAPLNISREAGLFC